MSTLELKVPPPVLALAGAGLMWLVARKAALAPFSPVPGLAAALAAAGAAIFVAAGIQFLVRRTSIDPRHPDRASTLLTGGLYRFSRNPIYLADALLLAAWGAWLADALAFAVLPAFAAWIVRFQVVPEERALQARFGAQYEAYRSRVRRWL